MNDKFRFDGQVAVVTGAGRGIGRSYAELLAARGASVVVNDLGGATVGGGGDAGPAEGVVAKIVADGGRAVADASDISMESGAYHMIQTALDSFGRIDVLINNAGNFKAATFGEANLDDLAQHMRVHLTGTFLTSLAAWPHMVAANYGRIVNTASSGIFGGLDNVAYAAVKAGTIGMTRQMCVAGASHGIKVNVIAPAAATRMWGSLPTDTTDAEVQGMSTSLVAPIVAFLAHANCPVSGEVYQGGASRFARFFIASTQGWVYDGGGRPTIEDVAEHWTEINDETDLSISYR